MPHAQLVLVKLDQKTIPNPVIDLLDRPVSLWQPPMGACHPNPISYFEDALRCAHFALPSIGQKKTAL